MHRVFISDPYPITLAHYLGALTPWSPKERHQLVLLYDNEIGGNVCFQFYFGKPATNLKIYKLPWDIFVALLNRYLKTSRLQYATIKYFQYIADLRLFAKGNKR